MAGRVTIKYVFSDGERSNLGEIYSKSHSLELSYVIEAAIEKDECVKKALEGFGEVLPEYIEKLLEINEKLKKNELEFETEEGRTKTVFGGDDGHSPGIISRGKPCIVMTIKE